jgi:hypothetical protein
MEGVGVSYSVRVVVVLVLLLSACARGGTAEEDSAGGEVPAGPLAEFFGYDEEFDSDRFAEQERRVQELIVACMAEEGFEYRPVEYPDPVDDPAFTAREELSAEEYAARYGYGISTFDPQVAQEEEFVDPNAELVEAMDEAEREAYDRALYGEMPEVAEGEEYVEYGFGSGCQGRASEEVYGGGDAAVQEELGPKYEQLYERIEADPRIAEANAAWSECMAEAGHDFATPQDAQNSIYEQMDALYQETYEQQPVPSEGEEAEFVEPEIDEARLAEVREAEIALAVADQRCAAEHLPEELRQEVSAEYEQAFIEENRELLERARAAEEG